MEYRYICGEPNKAVYIQFPKAIPGFLVCEIIETVTIYKSTHKVTHSSINITILIFILVK